MAALPDNRSKLLRQKDKNALETIFASVQIPIEVWAYGSRVSGGAHSGSDLDLVIRSADLTPLPPAIFNEVYWKIKDSNIPILVDLFDGPVYMKPFIKISINSMKYFLAILILILKHL